MNYKRNEAGDVMVRDAKGNPKFISEKLAQDKQLMKAMHFEVVEAPVNFCDEFKVEEKTEEIPVQEITPVAETLTAKPKSKTKK